MRKEELRKLKRINATPKMIELAKNNEREMVYKNKSGSSYVKRDTVYDMMVRCQTRGKYLMVCVFFPDNVEAGNLIPSYEIYCNPEGNQYITRIMFQGEETKWSTSMVTNLGRVGINTYHYYWHPEMRKRIWQNPEGEETIRNFLKTKEKGLWGLQEWQQSVRNKKIKEAEKREQAPWDQDMKRIPKVLPSFRDWMKKEAVNQYFIFYEYSKKGATVGYCSHCGKEVPIENPSHNKESKCCKCGAEIQYKVTSKIKTLGTRKYTGQLIQKMKGGVVIRSFEGQQWYRDVDYRQPNSYLSETERILLFDNGTMKRYVYDMYKNKKLRWILDKGYTPYIRTYYWQRTIKVYKRNLASLKRTVLKNSAIDLWETLPTDVANYLVMERGNPAIEKLAKIGMFNLAKGLMKATYNAKLLDEGATELTKMLKIDAARLKRLKAINGDVSHLKWFQYEKSADKVFPDELIKDFGDVGIESISDFDFIPIPLSLVKVWNYLKKQSAMCGESLERVRRTWMDYLNMAKKAKLNVKSDMIAKPKDLKAKHQEVILILQSGAMEKEAKKLAKKWPKVNENVKKLKKFEYSDRKFCVLAPEGILDIVKEGTSLQHCVHTCDFYFDRIQKDESYLFFLRRAENKDIPWYTLEVEPSGNIRQKRTTGDNQNKDFEEAVKFLRKWQKEFVKRMTEEEKELGIKADKARLEEYANLRKNGNKVWHGKLAGQLLADVLENDFMAAVG